MSNTPSRPHPNPSNGRLTRETTRASRRYEFGRNASGQKAPPAKTSSAPSGKGLPEQGVEVAVEGPLPPSPQDRTAPHPRIPMGDAPAAYTTGVHDVGRRPSHLLSGAAEYDKHPAHPSMRCSRGGGLGQQRPHAPLSSAPTEARDKACSSPTCA